MGVTVLKTVPPVLGASGTALPAVVLWKALAHNSTHI